MVSDDFPDDSALETEFCECRKYTCPIEDIDGDELGMLVSEGYIRVDEAAGWAILADRGWDWCRHRRAKNRAAGDSFGDWLPHFVSKADFAARTDMPIEDVEAACAGRLALATNRIGFVDVNLGREILGIDGHCDFFSPQDGAYARPDAISDSMHQPGGWVYVSNVRTVFRQHDLQIEIYSVEDPDGGYDWVSLGRIYGPRGHIAEIPLDDDGMTMMPYDTAAAILRDHAEVELTEEMLTAAWPDPSDWRAFRT